MIVGPKRVVVKILRRDGSVKEKKRIDISHRGAPVAERTQERKPPRDKPQWRSKDWQANVMGMNIKGRVERRKNDIKGFLRVPMPFTGKRKIYNFRGRINGQDVTLRSGGHSFRGKIRPDGKVAGNVYIDGGPTVPLVSPVPLP